MTVQSAAPVTWSKSQVAALKDCQRKFIFNLSSSVKPETAALKKIKNRYLWTGSLLHDEIGTLLKIARQGSSLPDVETVVAGVREKMRAQFKSSREALPDAERLFEHVYNVGVGREAWQRQWDAVERGLRWFLSSKWLARLVALGPECWKAVDEILSFTVGDVKAYAKIDCAVESNGRFFLIDWKTSSPTPSSEEGLQVAALYAHEVWGAEADQIEAVAVSVTDGKTFHAQIDEDSLMNTYLRIEEEAGQLEEVRSQSEGLDPMSLPLPQQIELCRHCNYQKMCHPNAI